MNSVVGALFLLSGCAALISGLLDVIAPSLMTRLQVSSTARHGGSRKAVGTGVQRALGIDPDSDPWDDPAVKRKVRWLGLALSVFGAAVLAVGGWMLASG